MQPLHGVPEARQMAVTALEWSLSPEAHMDSAIGLAVVEVETDR